MSVLQPSKLESHTVGTSGANALVNGNWEQLNKILNPVTVESTDPDEYHMLVNAFLKDTSPTLTDGRIMVYDATGKKFVAKAQMGAVADATDAASVILRLNELLAALRTRGDLAT